ncbi:MAG: DUF1801 domain-containing protein [Planctomycetes bacterium]|nr:DUF1801 domain-containing protein [Planctomycetota bacterium]
MARPTSHEDYLAALPPSQRAALQRLRRQIAAAAPGAVETITYSLPGFRLDGKILVCYAARAGHCSFHPMSDRTLADHAAAVARFDTSPGTLRFQPSAPPSAPLVRKLVRARVAELEEAAAARAKPKAKSKPKTKPKATASAKAAAKAKAKRSPRSTR